MILSGFPETHCEPSLPSCIIGTDHLMRQTGRRLSERVGHTHAHTGSLSFGLPAPLLAFAGKAGTAKRLPSVEDVVYESRGCPAFL